MVYYLADSIFIKLLFIISNISLIYAIYLINLLWILKLIILILAISCNINFFISNNFIKAFYLSEKTILLTKKNQQIKVNYVKASYCSSLLIILCFARGAKTFIVPIFRDAVNLTQFKKLQLLARYNIFLSD